jgi:hypothetical protein
VVVPEVTKPIKDMLFQNNAKLCMASEDGLYILDVETSLASLASGATTFTFESGAVSKFDIDTGLPSSLVLCLANDVDDTLWIGTDAGLARMKGGIIDRIYTDTNTELLSSRITGIAIRNTDVRYVATASGVCEMQADRFARLEADSDTYWNNNVKAVLWREPNILWVSTLSHIAQVQIEEVTRKHQVLIYDLADYALNATAYDDLRNYYVVDNLEDVDEEALVEVYVNGRLVPFGYVVSIDKKVVQFESPLKPSDVVQVKFRNDLSLFATMRQNKAEIASVGKKTKRIEQLETAGHIVYARVNIDDVPSLLKYDSGIQHSLPFDSIALDTTPPTGKLKIIRQTDVDKLLVEIQEANDNLSGVAQMIISNFPNFTTDGITPQTPVEFAEQAIHILDASTQTGMTMKIFDSGEGLGRKIIRYKVANSTDDTIYVGTGSPAKIFKLNMSTSQWSDSIVVDGVATTVFDSNPASSVDFIYEFGNFLYVGVGKTGGSSKVYFTSDGVSYTLKANIAAEHINAATTFRRTLWLGDSSGQIHKFDGVAFGTPIDSGADAIHALMGVFNILYAATGTDGKLIALDVRTLIPQVAATLGDANLTALNAITYGGFTHLYVGAGSNGTIYDLLIENDGTFKGSFRISFASTAATVSRLRDGDGGKVISGSVGKAVFQQAKSDDGESVDGWSNIATFADDVRDFYFFTSTTNTVGDLWAVTDSKVYKLLSATDSKTVYLKLFDGAGNETANLIFDNIKLDALLGFVNENRILTLTPSGVQVDAYEGNNPFYSAKRIEQDIGEYYSEVFFGTNNLITWDLLSFIATVPTGTEVTIYLRAADSREACLVSDWQASYTSNYQSGVDISFIRGKYIQFKAVLSTIVAEITPILKKVVIRFKINEATHFFTTNFEFTSPVSRGLLTAKTIKPVSADIVFGIDTNNSTDFGEYQIIDPDSIFVSNSDQTGTGLRVGIKLVTPTPGVYAVDPPSDTGPASIPLYTNAITRIFNPAVTATYQFRFKFYSDVGMTNLVYTADSALDATGFIVQGNPLTIAGYSATSSVNMDVFFVPPTDAEISCNTYYWIKEESLVTNVVEDTFTDHAFVVACNVNYLDAVEFIYKALATNSGTHWKATIYTDPTRQVVHKIYYSGTNAALWQINSSPYPSGGANLVINNNYTITLTPPPSDFEESKIYYVVFDFWNGSLFSTYQLSRGWTFRVSDPVSSEACGAYANVAIVKNFAMRFQLKDNSFVTIN